MEREKNNKINRFNILFIYVQLILTILTIIMLIIFLVKNNGRYLLQLFLGLDLIVMGYNNHLLYKRKGISIVYAIIGVVILITDLLLWLGV